MEKKLGCLTTSGLLAAVLTLVFVGGAVAARGGVIFSPGELNAQSGEMTLGGVASHAELSRECDACHVAPWHERTMADQCVSCHTEIANQIGDPNTLHGALMNDGNTTCRVCHSEHNGPEAALTTMSTTDFPHDVVGFSLQAHAQQANGAPFACQDCHQKSLVEFDVAVCEECHQAINPDFTQFHTAAFGVACLDCHDGIDTYGADFDHNQFFPLEGAHASGACGGCHQVDRTVAEFRDTPQECYACHAEDDEHDGSFGQNCAVCHTPVDWEQATFDHSLSDFPLEGKHVDVECQVCHVDNVYKGTPQECYACHEKDDQHNGEFGTDCAACHTPVDWEQATFDHSRSDFPLDGAHVNVECAQCHQDNVFAGTPQQCEACHAEPAYHAGLFGADCASCHSTAAWSPAQYDRLHTFPINHGESGRSACTVCHPDSLNIYTCYGCHEHTPSKIEREHREEGISNFTNCVECHPTGREEEGGGGDD